MSTTKDAATRANVARFDEIAASWDDNPTRSELAQAIGRAILKSVDLKGDERALEFGSGTGLITALLAPTLGHVVASDNSPGMLDALRDKAATLGLSNVEPRRVDIGQDVPEGPFDLIFSGMTMHHIGDVASLLSRLAGQLAPGGRIAVADLETEDGTFHESDEGIMHHGFDPAQIANWLTEAGLTKTSTTRIHVVRKDREDYHPREYPIFLATAVKPG